MVETLEYDDGMLIESRFSFVSESTIRDTTSPLSLIQESTLDRTSTQYGGRVESVGSCYQCFEFGNEGDFGCVHLSE